jgi:hypothetical protein
MNMASPSKPLDLQRLCDDLLRLGTYGSVSVDVEHIDWMRSIGIGDVRSSRFVASLGWLQAALPVASEDELVARTLLRDPEYRLHVDCALAAVLLEIGKAARWSRFEELLHGRVKPFAPRFVSLLAWACKNDERKAYELTGEDILRLAGSTEQNESTFAGWDQRLWGVTGVPATLFPQLEELYLKWIGTPVYVSVEDEPAASALAVALVRSAESGDGVELNPAVREWALELMRRGAPVRLPAPQASSAVFLVGPAEFSLASSPSGEFRSGSAAVPHSAANSHAGIGLDLAESTDLWSLEEQENAGYTFLAVDPRSDVWPEAQSSVGETILPAASALADLQRTRRAAPDADEALIQMCQHPFFGVFIQALLLEALDRELGDETLVLAPPTASLVDEIETQTTAFYRPRRDTAANAAVSRATLELGSIDQVLGAAAASVNLGQVFTPLRRFGGPWSYGLHLFRSVEIVTARHDRWALSPNVLDRLHGGGMMTGVIRRGKSLREGLHHALHALWEKRRSELDGEVMYG